VLDTTRLISWETGFWGTHIDMPFSLAIFLLRAIVFVRAVTLTYPVHSNEQMQLLVIINRGGTYFTHDLAM